MDQRVEWEGKTNSFVLTLPYNHIELVKARNIPSRRFRKSDKAWVCKASLDNVDYIAAQWPKAAWSKEANTVRIMLRDYEKRREETLAKKESGLDLSVLDQVPFKHKPFKHQATALLLGRDQREFAYLMDQGTGKTKTLIDDAAYNFREDKIDALLVIAPNSVKTNWVSWQGADEISNHMPPDVKYVKAVWISDANGAERKLWKDFEIKLARRQRDEMIVLAINIDAIIVPRLYDFLEKFCRAFRTMIVVDESTRIKTPSAQRTKAAKKLRRLCSMARILSGTPVIKSPLDAYSQFEFLDPNILRFGSFYAFRNRYAVMGGFENRVVIHYKNLDELTKRISSCSYRVTKEECLDLPPKVYQKRYVTITKRQGECYIQMKLDMVVNFKNNRVEAPIVLTQMLRFQQITGGYLPLLDANGDQIGVQEIVEPKNNPKIKEVLDIVDEAGDQKFIVWARFTHEIDAILTALTKHGIKAVRFDGQLSDAEKKAAREAFQSNPEIQGLVGNQAAGGIGLNLYAATIVIYYSNSFDTEQRVQSEDRAHRIGTTKSVTYFDLIMPATVDVKIVATLRNNKRIAAEVMQDGWQEWI